MRIDDANRASLSSDATKTESVRADKADRAQSGGISSTDGQPDAASISDMACALGTNDARLEGLRMQVERGEYNISPQAIAGSIIDEHIVG